LSKIGLFIHRQKRKAGIKMSDKPKPTPAPVPRPPLIIIGDSQDPKLKRK